MKKLILLSMLLILASLGSYAQYYYIPHTNSPGQNPGGLNNDNEYPVGGGLPAGWTTIQTGPAVSPIWSAVQTLPFSFDFNGTPVTQFKVSTSGVLTFTTSAVAVPPAAKAALPNVNIPDMSVCIWGFHSASAGDNIVKKTFGTAPNRQQWVFFTSYNANSGTSNSVWTYWSIVLEETTNKIYLVDQRTANFTPTFSMGIQVDGSTAYSVNGSPNVGALAANDPTPLDNAWYEFLPGTQPASEAQLLSLNVQQYVVTPGSVAIGGTLVNNGASVINSITIQYESGGTTYTDVKTGLNIPFPQSYTFTHATPLSITNPQLYPVKVWIELAGDANQVNDTLNTEVHGLTFLPNKKVVVEEATGTWCGWCPRGTVYMDSIRGLYPNTVELVAVHNADPMAVPVYDAGMGAFISGYPSGLVDRKDLNIDPLDFIAKYLERINDVPPCDISVSTTFNSITRVIDMTVSATFATDLAGDFRFNAVVVEEDVTGTGDGTNANNQDYDQVNYYSFQVNNLPLQGAGHNWQTETDPVPATTMEYDHVGRAIMGGWDGAAGSLPATIAANSTHSYSFSYTLPVGYDETQVHVVGWITDNSSGNILNANHSDLSVGIETVGPGASFDAIVLGILSENARLKVTLKNAADLKVELYDAAGKMLMLKNNQLSTGEFIYNLQSLHLVSGIYTAKISSGNEVLTRRFAIVK